MGQDRVDQFVRFYVTPGVNHPGNGVMKDGKAVPSMAARLDGIVWLSCHKRFLHVVQNDIFAGFAGSARPSVSFPISARPCEHNL
jgi:hypothetical protein